jgi:hypothetical protein
MSQSKKYFIPVNKLVVQCDGITWMGRPMEIIYEETEDYQLLGCKEVNDPKCFCVISKVKFQVDPESWLHTAFITVARSSNYKYAKKKYDTLLHTS